MPGPAIPPTPQTKSPGGEPPRDARGTHVLYLCYFGLREPLVQTQVLPYLRQIRKAGYRVSLLTFEARRQSSWSASDVTAWQDRLRGDGIEWRCLTYHSWPSLPAKVYDIVVGAWFAWRYVRRSGVAVVHARSHVAAVMGAVVKRLTGVRLIFDIRGFLAEEYVDAGHWPAGGYLFRLTKAAERRLMTAADAFVVLTEKARAILFPGCANSDGAGRPVEVIPCCVDWQRFQAADGPSRDSVRKEMGLEQRRVLVYVGALGGWYLTEEMAQFLAAAHRQSTATYSLILTQSPPRLIGDRLRDLGVPEDAYLIREVPAAEVPRYLKAADLAISFIKPCFSKLASSPTKFAEYLASGLPVICNAGIGDVDTVIEEDGVGVLLREFRPVAYLAALVEAEAMLGPAVSDRCRASARARFDLESVGGVRYRRLYERLLQANS